MEKQVTLTLSGGKNAVITMAGFVEGAKLQKAVFAAAASSGLDLGSVKDLMKNDLDVGTIVRAFVAIDSSPAVDKLLWNCLERCTINDQKITPALFESEPELRVDYFPVVVKCLEVNLAPFLHGLRSAFVNVSASLKGLRTQQPK